MKRLSAWNPLDHLRLLWWTLMEPQQLKAHREQYGEKAELPAAKWLVSTLFWLPLFLPFSAVGFEIIPFSLDSEPLTATHYLWANGGLFIAWLLTGVFGDRDEEALGLPVRLTIVMGIALAIVLTRALAGGLAVVLGVGLVIVLAIVLAVVQEFELAVVLVGGLVIGLVVGLGEELSVMRWVVLGGIHTRGSTRGSTDACHKREPKDGSCFFSNEGGVLVVGGGECVLGVVFVFGGMAGVLRGLGKTSKVSKLLKSGFSSPYRELRKLKKQPSIPARENLSGLVNPLGSDCKPTGLAYGYWWR